MENRRIVEMSDLEMVKACAQAMGIEHRRDSRNEFIFIGGKWYEHNFDPLHDDAQAMALVKKFRLQVWNPLDLWFCVPSDGWLRPQVSNADLNRAIVECVSKVQADLIQRSSK